MWATFVGRGVSVYRCVAAGVKPKTTARERCGAHTVCLRGAEKSDPQCRAELDVGTLGRKFWGRLCGFCTWAVGHEDGGRGLRFDRDNLEQIRIIDDSGSDEVADDVMDPGAGRNHGPGESTVRYELMED